LKIWAKKISLWHPERTPRMTRKLRFKNRDVGKQLYRFVIKKGKFKKVAK